MPRHPALYAAAFAAFASCSVSDDGGLGGRTCGDGTCEPLDCETSARCPEDCGACIGMDCDQTAAQGKCTQPCSSSCECGSLAEVCTADYGESPGRCIPTDCVQCKNFEACEFSPNADGACLSVTCN